MNICECSQWNNGELITSRLQNCCPHTLAECLWEDVRTVICILPFRHQSLPFTNNTRQQLCTCENVSMCDHRRRILVLIQHSLTFCSDCVCTVSLSLYKSVTIISIIYANIKNVKKGIRKNFKTCVVPVLHTNLFVLHIPSQSWLGSRGLGPVKL